MIIVKNFFCHCRNIRPVERYRRSSASSSFSHNVFYSYTSSEHQNVALCGNGLISLAFDLYEKRCSIFNLIYILGKV